MVSILRWWFVGDHETELGFVLTIQFSFCYIFYCRCLRRLGAIIELPSYFDVHHPAIPTPLETYLLVPTNSNDKWKVTPKVYGYARLIR